MKKTIWKYKLETTNHQMVMMPEDAEILCVQTQSGIPCLWAMIDPTQLNKEERYIEIFDTGHSMAYESDETYRKYIGTYQLTGGALISHVFEKIL